jgi:transcriptional regulator with XRE-family HTH domain
MDIEIGKKIQLARKEAGLTQEQASEMLSVSRQTISNWENEKSYPDIISVIKMSDLYGISLDILLKGEEKMSNNYLQYLEDSTNVVKSNQKKGKTILISIYLLIWSFAMIVFWWLMDPSDAGGFSLIFIWGLIPMLTFVESLLIGINDYWGKLAWFAVPVMGLGLMLTEFFTFEAANHMTFGNTNYPDPYLLLVGAAISALGLGVGKGISVLKRREKEK